MHSTLQLTREPVAGRTPLLTIPGTYCSPVIFEEKEEALFPFLQLLPVSWMRSPGPWDLPTLGRRVSQLVKELDFGPALLVGHSTGGPIALMAALTEPALVKGLLLVDTGASTRGHGDIEKIIQALEAGPSEQLFDHLLRRSFFHQPDAELLHHLSVYANNAPREAALEALRSQATLDLTEKLSSLTMPVVVLHGKHDQARPLAHAEELVARLPHAELQIVDAGHTPMVETPAGYVHALQRLCVLTGLSD